MFDENLFPFKLQSSCQSEALEVPIKLDFPVLDLTLPVPLSFISQDATNGDSPEPVVVCEPELAVVPQDPPFEEISESAPPAPEPPIILELPQFSESSDDQESHTETGITDPPDRSRPVRTVHLPPRYSEYYMYRVVCIPSPVVDAVQQKSVYSSITESCALREAEKASALMSSSMTSKQFVALFKRSELRGRVGV